MQPYIEQILQPGLPASSSLISVLLQLQKVKNDLEMVLSTVRAKNKQLEEDLKR